MSTRLSSWCRTKAGLRTNLRGKYQRLIENNQHNTESHPVPPDGYEKKDGLKRAKYDTLEKNPSTAVSMPGLFLVSDSSFPGAWPSERVTQRLEDRNCPILSHPAICERQSGKAQEKGNVVEQVRAGL